MPIAKICPPVFDCINSWCFLNLWMNLKTIVVSVFLYWLLGNEEKITFELSHILTIYFVQSNEKCEHTVWDGSWRGISCVL